MAVDESEELEKKKRRRKIFKLEVVQQGKFYKVVEIR